jgi:hypothetical protein
LKVATSLAETQMEKRYYKINDECGCTCFISAPCSHCFEDHENIDNHPVCDECGEILYDATDFDIRKHKILEFKIKF